MTTSEAVSKTLGKHVAKTVTDLTSPENALKMASLQIFATMKPVQGLIALRDHELKVQDAMRTMLSEGKYHD